MQNYKKEDSTRAKGVTLGITPYILLHVYILYFYDATAV